MPDFRFGPYRLTAASRELWREDRLVPTPRLVFDCLLYLILRRDRAVGRDELVAAIWGRVDVIDGQVNQLMLRVRRLLADDPVLQNAIRTVPGFGYRWTSDVEEITAERTPASSEPTPGPPPRIPAPRRFMRKRVANLARTTDPHRPDQRVVEPVADVTIAREHALSRR